MWYDQASSAVASHKLTDVDDEQASSCLARLLFRLEKIPEIVPAGSYHRYLDKYVRETDCVLSLREPVLSLCLPRTASI